MAIQIRDFAEADRSGVESLYEITFGAGALALWRARHRWQYYDHPVCRRVPSRLWVADRGDKIVGFMAAFPMQLKVGASERTILLPCDLMVAKEARFGQNLGPRLMDTYLDASGGLGLSLAHSQGAATLFEKLGWQAKMLGPICMRPRTGHPIASRVLTAERMPARLKNLPWPLVQGIASPLGTAALAALHLIHRPRRRHGVEVKRLGAFGADYDALWRELSPDFPIVGVRDRAFLQWRFMDDPCTEHTVFEARSARGLEGYVAVCFARARGLRFGRIMDLFCRPSDEHVIDSLLRAAIDHLDRGAADVIATRGLHPRIRQRVRRFLYLAPPSVQFTARVLCRDASIAPLVYDEASWHTSHADGDEDFVT